MRAVNLRAPLRVRGQHPVVEEKLDFGQWRQRGQWFEELHRFGEQVRRPVAPGPLERHTHPAVGQAPQAATA